MEIWRSGVMEEWYKVKNPRPEDAALFGASCKGAERVPSDPGVDGVME
jgi:hypothetical protein